MKRIIVFAILSISLTGCSLVSEIVSVTNFDECIATGNPAMESYPRQCSDGNNTFTEYIGNEMEKMDLIRIDSPRPNTVITSPLSITGEAVGNWFFEADFPVELYDASGNLLARGIATAQSDWMTESFVPFLTKLQFSKPEDKHGLLILRKDNPSGIPLYNDSLEVPVYFK